MSKAGLKKQLTLLNKEQIIDILLEAYDSRKETKEYFEFWLNPDEKEELQRTTEKLFRQFFLSNGKNRKKLYKSEINKIVKDFWNICSGEEVRCRLLFKLSEFFIIRALTRFRNLSIKPTVDRHLGNALVYMEETGQKEMFGQWYEKLQQNYNKIRWY
ncbi:MAG: hypothetical protein K2N03_02225 [Muribaculaceae bacterium]|nr:hypothetical protein [Muribaculaceae bacterium]